MLLCLNVQGWDKQTTLGIFGATVCFAPPSHIKANFKEASKGKPINKFETKLKRQEVTRFTREFLHPVDKT